MTFRDKQDANLLVVAAIEEYAVKHRQEPAAVIEFFREQNLLDLIRSQYAVLHTQPLSESAAFVEDVLKQRKINYPVQ